MSGHGTVAMEPNRPASPPEEPKGLPFALVGFYLSCAGVALGATVGSAGYLWFQSKGALVFGIAMTAVCAVTCFTSLRSLRR